jgi:hypothetical protein
MLRRGHLPLRAAKVGLAINCLSNIVTEELACDLVADVVSLLNSGKTYDWNPLEHLRSSSRVPEPYPRSTLGVPLEYPWSTPGAPLEYP